MYSSPAGGNRFPFLGFLMWKGCWSHVKEETSYRLKYGPKRKKNQVFLLGVGFLLPSFPLKLKLLYQGKMSARCTGHFDTMLTSPSRIGKGDSSAHGKR